MQVVQEGGKHLGLVEGAKATRAQIAKRFDSMLTALGVRRSLVEEAAKFSYKVVAGEVAIETPALVAVKADDLAAFMRLLMLAFGMSGLGMVAPRSTARVF